MQHTNRHNTEPHTPASALLSGTVASLDGLRAASVAIVMLAHSGLGHIVPGGFGVTMFFFISGFIITTLLVREWQRDGRIELRQFYIRRALRLYPALLAFIFAIIIAGFFITKPPSLLSIFGGLGYFMNYLVIFSPHSVLPFGNHLWSLAVEVHFYIFFPLLFSALAQDFRKLAAALIGICVASLAVRTGFSVGMSDPQLIYEYAYQASEARLDSIAFGALCAVLLLSPSGERICAFLTRPEIVAASVAILIATLLIRKPVFRDTIRYSLQGIALMSIVTALVVGPGLVLARNVLNSRLAIFIGGLSYSLYLWHPAVFEFGKHLIGGQFTGQALGWFLAVAVAAMSVLWIETPMLALRRRFGSAAGPRHIATPPQLTVTSPSTTEQPMQRRPTYSPPARARVDGWPINLANRSDALHWLTKAAVKGEGFSFYTLNLDLLVKLRTDTAFIAAMRKADYTIADGWPVAMIARRDDPSVERTTGADLVMPLAEVAARHRLPIYLFGTSPDVLKSVSRSLTNACPGIQIAGMESPPHGFDPKSANADAAIERIRASGAKMCFVALGAPKQEILADRALEMGVECGFICIGAGLDFIAGAQVRAPSMMRTHGMEWLWRMITNPRRLAGRYATCAWYLARLVVQDSLFRRRTL